MDGSLNIPESVSWLDLADFISFTSDAIIIIDQGQRILFVNGSAETIFNFQVKELVGKPIDFLIPERLVERHRQQIRDFINGPETAHCTLDDKEMFGRRKDGSEFPIEASISRVIRGGKTAIIIFLQDISNRKQTEQRLSTWVKAFENADWGVVVGRPEATTLEIMNPAFARLYGSTIEELIGLPIQNLYALEERPKVAEWLRLANEQGHIAFEARHMRRDGTFFTAAVDVTAVKDELGKVLYRVVNVQDITARKQAEDALREGEQRYAAIIASMEEGIVVQDAHGIIVTCNASAERILGLTSDQMMGLTSFDPRWRAVLEDGSPAPGESHPAVVSLRTGKPVSNFIMGVHKPDDNLTWVSVNSQPLFHLGEEKPYAVHVTFSDITERRQMYQLMEQNVEKRTRELTTLLELSRTVASTMELNAQLTLILKQLKTVVDYTGAGIVVPEGDRFVMIEYEGPTPREQIVNQAFPANISVGYQMVAETRQPFIIADIWGDDPYVRSMNLQVKGLIKEKVAYARSWLGLPMIVKDKLIGAMRLDHVEPNHFNETQARLALVFAEQAAIAIEKAHLYEQAQELAALEERQKLARELHDSVSQALYGIALGTRTARTLVERDPAKAIAPLDYALSLAEAGLAEMRALIFELRPESLEREGLTGAITKQADALRARHSIHVETAICEEPQAPLIVKEVLYRITQETFNNVIKHAHASQVNLRLEYPGDKIVLEIKDNGQGFDPAAAYPGHIGLTSMSERANRVGGTIHIKSTLGQGTAVRVEIPLKPGNGFS